MYRSPLIRGLRKTLVFSPVFIFGAHPLDFTMVTIGQGLARRDIFLSVTLGVSRIIQTKAKFKERHSSPIPKMNLKTPKKK